MSHSTPGDNEFFRISNIAFDVGLIFGSTTDQGIARARRCIFRAALDIVGHDRRWTWLKTKDSILTIAQTSEYSLRDDVNELLPQMWMEGATAGPIRRVPSTEFVQRVPDPSTTFGNPCLFDEQGVDSSGSRVISLYPIPSSQLEIFYRFSRTLMPFSDDSNDIRVIWGMPPKLLNPLTQKAAALASQGVSSTKYVELTKLADSMIEEAYAADQAKPNTEYRAPMHGERDHFTEWPQLPPRFGY